MNKTMSLLVLSLSLSAPALATCLYFGGMISTEILFGTYTIAGLLYITAIDYSPRAILASTENTQKPNAKWIRRSMGYSKHSARLLRAEKTTA